MKKTIQTIAINILSNLLYQAIFSFIIFIGTTVVSVVTLTQMRDNSKVNISTWVVFILFLILSIGNIVSTILKFIKKENTPNFPAIKSDISYNYIRTELYFADREHIKCYREVRFTVLCEEMKFIRKQFTWTGDGYKGTFLDKNSRNQNFKIDDSVRRLPPQIYDVEFDCTKRKGDSVSYKLISEVEDISHVMQPFISQHINEPTKKLNLILSVPVGMVKNVRTSVYCDSTCKIKIGDTKDVEVKTYAGINTYEINIKKPELLHIYRIEWDWQ